MSTSAGLAAPSGAAATPIPTTVLASDPFVGTNDAYPVPQPLPSGPPGTLLRAERLPAAAGTPPVWRLLYLSSSATGKPVAVSGVALIPSGVAPPGGWLVLSFTHGTTGMADRCAPSRDIDQRTLLLANAFLAQGIAVVATDYEGLGTPGRHPYLSGESEGRSAIDIVRAVRQLPGSSSGNRYLVWGHSQGGHAALFAGELAGTYGSDLRLVGVVAGAPPSRLADVGEAARETPFKGYVPMVLAGLAAADPTLDLAAVLTPKALELLPAVDTVCTSGVFAAYRALPLDQIIVRSGLATAPWQAALTAAEPGRRKINAPVLIVHGDKDEQIPVETSASLLSIMCASGTTVERRVYPGQDHGGAAVASFLDVLRWAGDRAAGRPAVSNCA